MNPYWQKNFFSFCLLFGQRLWQLMSGTLGIQELASDEIQLFVLFFVSLGCASIGVFLVLKKMTMLANSLSHTILVGIALAFLIAGSTPSLQMLLIASLISGLLTSLITHWLTHVMRLQEDASIGLVFTALFALGVVIVTVYTRSAHIGTEAIMGNVDALRFQDLALAFSIFMLNTLFVLLFYKQLTLSAFDPSLASLLGQSPGFCSLLLMALATCTAVAAFRAVGVLLFLALLVGPVVAARMLTHRLSILFLIAGGIGLFSSFLGVALARHLLTVYDLALSTAGLVVACIGFCLLLCMGAHGLKKKFKRHVVARQ